MPFGIETIYGIAFLVAMVAIGAALTWSALTEDLAEPAAGAEAAD